MTAARPLRLLAALCFTGALTACGTKAPRPNALLVTLDTTRADAVGACGGPRGITPRLDALARDGITFTNARTVVPITLPAHTSMLTGLYPPRHGIRDNELWSLPESAETLVERAAAAGYQTAGFVAAPVLDRVFGLAQGFETWSQPDRAQEQVDWHTASLPAETMVERALAWFEGRDRARPFFMWVHLYDPHLPLAAPERFQRQANGHAYLAEVARVDHAVGQLLDALEAAGELERTAVLVVGDHGEGNGDHGEATHGHFVYDATLRVPLILRPQASARTRLDGPGPHGQNGQAGRTGRIDTRVASVADVAPTLGGLLGLGLDAVPLNDGSDGIDLLGERAADRGVYFESYHGYLHFGWGTVTGWADDGGKYVHSEPPELYRTDADPGEQQNLIGSTAAARLQSYRTRLGAAAAGARLARTAATADAELVEQIRALGYVEAGAIDELPDPLEPTGLPSPHSRADELDQIGRATDLSRAGDLAGSLRAYRAVLASNPRNTTARGGVAYALMESGQYAEAAAEFELLLGAAPETAGTHGALAACLELTGEPERALVHYRRAAELDPRDAELLRSLASLLQRSGAGAEAEQVRAQVKGLLGYGD